MPSAFVLNTRPWLSTVVLQACRSLRLSRFMAVTGSEVRRGYELPPDECALDEWPKPPRAVLEWLDDEAVEPDDPDEECQRNPEVELRV